MVQRNKERARKGREDEADTTQSVGFVVEQKGIKRLSKILMNLRLQIPMI